MRLLRPQQTTEHSTLLDQARPFPSTASSSCWRNLGFSPFALLKEFSGELLLVNVYNCNVQCTLTFTDFLYCKRDLEDDDLTSISIFFLFTLLSISIGITWVLFLYVIGISGGLKDSGVLRKKVELLTGLTELHKCKIYDSFDQQFIIMTRREAPLSKVEGKKNEGKKGEKKQSSSAVTF